MTYLDRAKALLEEYMREHPAFRAKPVGAPYSAAREAQNLHADLEDRTRAFLSAPPSAGQEPVAYRWRFDEYKPWVYTHGPMHPDNSRAMSESEVECELLYTALPAPQVAEQAVPDAKDAPRYRWLRENMIHLHCADDNTDSGNFVWTQDEGVRLSLPGKRPKSIDAAIDAAIAAQEPSK